jgi:hypothetical protein
MEVFFIHTYKISLQLFMCNYCYELTLQDYWRLSFSVT